MKLKKIIGILIFLSMILIMFISGYIFSKNYKAISDYQSQRNVVKWSFESEDIQNKINLSDEKIFPGSSGSFQIEVDAIGAETEIEYEVIVSNEKNIPTNLIFYAETKDQLGTILNKTKEYNSFNKLALENLNGKIPVDYNNQKRIITVFWEWKYDENTTKTIDSNDAILSVDEYGNSSLDFGFNIEIVGKQA